MRQYGHDLFLCIYFLFRIYKISLLSRPEEVRSYTIGKISDTKANLISSAHFFSGTCVAEIENRAGKIVSHKRGHAKGPK